MAKKAGKDRRRLGPAVDHRATASGKANRHSPEHKPAGRPKRLSDSQSDSIPGGIGGFGEQFAETPDSMEGNMNAQNSAVDPLLTEDEAAARIRVKPQTLAVWRSARRYGLPYIKCGHLVRY